jgi:hypothetical protein
MRKISKKITKPKRYGGGGQIIDETKKGMYCESPDCGRRTHRLVSHKSLLYCKECFDAIKIRRRLQENKAWDKIYNDQEKRRSHKND